MEICECSRLRATQEAQRIRNREMNLESWSNMNYMQFNVESVESLT